jgi:predicted nuclease of predicted toxin-antitoxin system
VRILLDESLPRRLAGHLTGHEVRTVAQLGWVGLTNGTLLATAAATFDVLLTGDQNLEFQQNLSTLPMSVVVIVAESNRLESIAPLVPALLAALLTLKSRTVVRVGG